MLIVTNGSNTELLNHIQGLEVNQEVNGAYTASFASFNYENNPGYALLEEETVITIDGKDFKVKQLEEFRDSKRVTAVNEFFDLADYRQDLIYGGTRTFTEFITFVLGGTGWTFTSDISESRFIANFGEENVLVLLNALCATYECEYEVQEGKNIHFAKQIGPDNDVQYRYGYNIDALSKKVDTSNVKTYIEGRGSNNLFISYTSPLASNPKFGIKKADPVVNEDFTTSESLLEFLKQELNDTIEASFELDSIELTDKALGERVWLIYEPLNIEFQTRILKQTKTLVNNKLVTQKVVLGNTLPKNTTDILISQKIEIDQNRKEYRSRIEQTNDRILLEVTAVNSSIAALDIRAASIDLSVTQLDGRLGNAESSINIQAGQIQQRVTLSQYNGPTVTSLITQDPYSISLLAQNLTFQGLVTVTNLSTPGQTVIDGGNVYGSSFVVGRGTGSLMTMTSTLGSHTIVSNDAAGMAIQSSGSLSLRTGSGFGVFVPFSPLVAQAGFRVDSGISQFNTNVTVNANLNASTLSVQGATVATQAWVNANFVAK